MPDIVSTTNLPDITVTCRNSQGTAINANVLRLRRYSASFEVYNPYSILQLSEVLKDFRIRMGGRLVYSGTAVVQGIVNTGFVVVCEVTLSGAWMEVDILAAREGSSPLGEQFDAFIDDWKKAHEVDGGFKILASDIQNTLVGLQRWMEQLDLGIRSAPAANREGLEADVVQSMRDRLMEQVHPMMARFEQVAEEVPEDKMSTYKFYIRRQIHPLVLCSPFIYRTFHKPLGYAGDYEMVNMMLRSSLDGTSLFAKTLNHVFLETGPVIAHRNRITYLTKMLRQESSRTAQDGRRSRILNLGCGPAQEVMDFLRDEDAADMCDFSLLDFNPETLEYTRGRIDDLRARTGRATTFRYLERSVNQLLKQSSTGDAEMEWESYDLVYCAGLFDYLSQRVCKRMVEIFIKLIRPGGLLIVTNVSPTNPIRHWMEYVLEWNLIYRGDQLMIDMVPANTSGLTHHLDRDPTGVNLFLEIRRSVSGSPS
jgi:extracellular factor (EF) 3-hydroxypalmitic acid methyl ester biosynthesis protein